MRGDGVRTGLQRYPLLASQLTRRSTNAEKASVYQARGPLGGMGEGSSRGRTSRSSGDRTLIRPGDALRRGETNDSRQ